MSSARYVRDTMYVGSLTNAHLAGNRRSVAGLHLGWCTLVVLTSPMLDTQKRPPLYGYRPTPSPSPVTHKLGQSLNLSRRSGSLGCGARLLFLGFLLFRSQLVQLIHIVPLQLLPLLAINNRDSAVCLQTDQLCTQ